MIQPIIQTTYNSTAPGSTYYQLIVKSKDLVILRDWPKMRMSQKWSRSGNFNPGEKKMTVRGGLAADG